MKIPYKGDGHFPFEAARNLAGGYLVLTMIGAQLIWGTILPYVVGYYRDMGLSVTTKDLYAVYPGILVVSTFAFPFGSYFIKKIGTSLVTLGAGFSIIVFLLMASYSRNPQLFVLLYVIGIGICKGVAMTACLKSGWNYLPERKGLVSGIVMSGMSTGSVFYGLLCTRIVNPDNVQA